MIENEKSKHRAAKRKSERRERMLLRKRTFEDEKCADDEGGRGGQAVDPVAEICAVQNTEGCNEKYKNQRYSQPKVKRIYGMARA